jgi:hypothetical protein
MRSVELVVDYVSGPAHPNPRLAYGGVFKASLEADRAFAAAEPPTHDDWVATGLTGSVRGVVQGAKSFLTKQLDERLGFASPAGGGGQGLGQLAARLASVIPARLPTSALVDDGVSPIAGGADGVTGLGAPGSGGSDRTVGGGSGGATGPGGLPAPGRRGGQARLVGSPRVEVFNGAPYVVAKVLVPESTNARTVTAETFVIVEGGARETEVPAGARVPQVVQWQLAAETPSVVQGPTVALPPGPDSEWWVYATHVPDAVIRFRLSQEVARAQ